jgi:hypothetical protein
MINKTQQRSAAVSQDLELDTSSSIDPRESGAGKRREEKSGRASRRI